ncbi:TonB-dependent receptor, partial [Balneolaceae bacterium ANBcel3]|nr:TonB-dependent receptor [Balneolaceae bacterium ANBcel3]
PFLVTGSSETSVPMMPPWNGRLFAEYNLQTTFRLGVASRWAAKQHRTDQFEEPTDGYVLFDAYLQYQRSAFGGFHTITLTTENLLDAEYRNHLSRIKSVMPEPGRNIKLLYRVFF